MLPSLDTIRLMRFPFSVFLMPVFLLAVSQSSALNTTKTWLVFVILHLLVYPASNGYNSYIDRDTESIGGLERPPMPTNELFYWTLAMDITALLLSFFFVNPLFAVCVFLYIAASRAYSSPQIRLKKYALGGFLTVLVFQGGFTYFMASVGVSDAFELQNQPAVWWIIVATSLQIGGVYPLTQIYQHEADLKDGVVTISYQLGYRGTFIFSTLFLSLAMACYGIYFYKIDQINHVFWLYALLFPALGFFAWWFWQVWNNISAANFKNTMLMNALASLAMNLFGLILIFLL